MGIEPTLSAWEAEVLPLNYTRVDTHFTRIFNRCANGPAITSAAQAPRSRYNSVYEFDHTYTIC